MQAAPHHALGAEPGRVLSGPRIAHGRVHTSQCSYRVHSRIPATPPNASVNEDEFPVVHVPVAEREDGLEYLKIEDIRSQLEHQPSPFTKDNNAGGGFVGDKDLLQIDIVQYETEKSSGAQCQGLVDPVTEVCIQLPQVRFGIETGPLTRALTISLTRMSLSCSCSLFCPFFSLPSAPVHASTSTTIPRTSLQLLSRVAVCVLA